MLLSIIIPVYNTQDYLLESLNSIIKQLNKDIEVIIVNDGSTDDSFKIATKFIKKENNNNVCIYDKKNGGLSDARNYGLDLAKGKYIAFLDSDDFVCNDYVKNIYEIISTNDYDIISYGFNSCDVLGNYISSSSVILSPGEYLCNSDYKKYFFKASEWYAWKNIYKKDLFSDIRFPKGKRFEDLFTIPKIIIKANDIYVLNNNLVNYRRHSESITNNINDDDIDVIFKYLSEINFEDEELNYIHRYKTFMFLSNIILSMNAKEKIQYIKRIKVKCKCKDFNFKFLCYRYFPSFSMVMIRCKRYLK